MNYFAMITLVVSVGEGITGLFLDLKCKRGVLGTVPRGVRENGGHYMREDGCSWILEEIGTDTWEKRITYSTVGTN